ncbi:DNA primase large subunit isoform X3 [Pezoporus flaviventris]|uniref:DNA primase large subunit isoform X3 n=1 Tax=Pezoporus flaviventris TaxID=889875 RepID=UPI002AAFDA06|nr:DNA primase large subunit isoform X3 [Pezoporus flaviventris]
MEFSSRTRLRQARLAGDRRELYPHSLQFYLEPPTESISLVEFESFAIDRLKLLKVVENLGVSYIRGNDVYKTKLEAELRKLKFPYKALAEDDYEARRKDHISHFILRLAYCQSEDLRRWFLQQEMDLLRYRFNELTDSLRQKFLEHVNLSFEAISEDMKNELANELLTSTPGFSVAKVKEQIFYKVGLSEAVDLFRTRRVFIKDGFAYVPLKDIDAIVLSNYRTKLSKALAFDKGYAYSIRHNYGKEGKRTDYTPYSCMKIIMSNPPSQGDYHGCPFRHSDPELLKQKLQSYKIAPSGITQILELVKGMHYQLACQKYFELTHYVDDTGFSLNHPNQYFTESQRLLNGGRELKKEISNSGNSQQKNNSQEGMNSNSTLPSSKATSDAELEGLDEYFTED